MRHVRVLMRSIGFVDLFIQNVYIVPVFFLSILWTQIVNVGRKTISLVVRSQVEMSFRGKMPLVKNGATKISFRGVDFGGPFTCDHTSVELLLRVASCFQMEGTSTAIQLADFHPSRVLPVPCLLQTDTALFFHCKSPPVVVLCLTSFFKKCVHASAVLLVNIS